MNDTLKPCPFCGGEAVILKADQYHVFPDTYYVSCTKCTAGVGPLDTEAEAIEAWNRRTERTAKVEEVEKPNVFKCSECGQYFHQTSWGSPVEYCSRCGAGLEWK